MRSQSVTGYCRRSHHSWAVRRAGFMKWPGEQRVEGFPPGPGKEVTFALPQVVDLVDEEIGSRERTAMKASVSGGESGTGWVA